MIVLSRFPLEQRNLPLADHGLFNPLVADLWVGGQSVRLIGMHPPYPLSDHLSTIRNTQFEQVAGLAAEAPGPLVVAGDFNATPWSPWFQVLLRDGGLRDGAQGRGWQPTWMAHFPPLSLPIDHVLGNDRIAFETFGRGPDVGSDHLPITATLRILPAAARSKP